MYFEQVMIRAYFNKFKNIGSFTLDCIFDTIQYEKLSEVKHLLPDGNNGNLHLKGCTFIPLSSFYI